MHVDRPNRASWRHLNINDRFRRSRDSSFLEYLAANDGRDLGGVRGFSDEARQSGAIIELPDIVSRIGKKATQDALLTDCRLSGHSQIAGGTNCQVGAPHVKDIVHWMLILRCGPRGNLAAQIIVGVDIVVIAETRHRAVTIIDVALDIEIAVYPDSAVIP